MWLNVLQKIIMTNQKVKNLFWFQIASRNKNEFILLFYKLILYNLKYSASTLPSTLASAQKRKWQLSTGVFWWGFLVVCFWLVGWLAGCCQFFFPCTVNLLALKVTSIEICFQNKFFWKAVLVLNFSISFNTR